MQDIVPATGLTIYKPSPLWPPPLDDRSTSCSATPLGTGPKSRRTSGQRRRQSRSGDASHTARGLQDRGAGDQRVWRAGGDPEPDPAIYHQRPANTPACEPHAGLSRWAPAALFIASDREVLRDEIVYT
jgi:hypothetical protein